jgi:hypothetical protein
MQIRESKIATRALVAVLVLLCAAGCALLRRLDVESVAKSAEPPSNVALYVTVADGKQPLTDLSEENFRIYEDGQLLSPDVTRQMLLAKDSVALHKTLLLVDMSTATDPAIRRGIARGAAGLVATVRRNQDVTVMAFDGRPEPQKIGEFPKGGAGPDEITELTNFSSTDSSRNLHGAIIKAMQELDARLMTEKKPVRVGSLVVFTTGPDLAGRWSYEGLRTVLDKSSHRVFAIGVGPDKGFALSDLGRGGWVRAPSLTAANVAFEEMGLKVNAAYDSHYLLSYCSPARDGRRLLKVEVTHVDSDGNEITGTLHEEFEATSFGPGCDPSTTPRFSGAGAPAPPSSPPTTAPGDASGDAAAPAAPTEPAPPESPAPMTEPAPPSAPAEPE